MEGTIFVDKLLGQNTLNFLQGGLFPGLVLYLSFFYPRERLQIRFVLTLRLSPKHLFSEYSP